MQEANAKKMEAGQKWVFLASKCICISDLVRYHSAFDS